MKIFAAKLSPNTTSESLQALFEQFGVVTSSKVIMDRETGRSKCYGFIEMDDDEHARQAIEALNGVEYEGSVIATKEAIPHEDYKRANPGNYSYQPRREGGYPYRREGGYQPRREGGYQPRREGGYQPRHEGGYQPRREGGYPFRREGGYQPRREGGYQPRRDNFSDRPGYHRGYDAPQQEDNNPDNNF